MLKGEKKRIAMNWKPLQLGDGCMGDHKNLLLFYMFENF
jgi:hypothetical protein